MGQLIADHLRWFLRLVFPEPEPEMEERLMEMHREWCRSRSVVPSLGRLRLRPPSDEDYDPLFAFGYGLSW